MAEQVLARANVPEIVFVRCAYFMENWATALDIRGAPDPLIVSTITPLEWEIPMVAVADIGAVIASEALKREAAPKKPHVFELHGPRMYSPLHVQAAFSDALGKQVAVKPVAKGDLYGYYRRIFPDDVVPEWVEMTCSFLPGGVMKPGHVEEGTEVVNGKTELADAVKTAVESLL
ncbi:NAD(P)-binding domain protein [Metarhizium album ARSEF 1941]|uniref:NAD(P)-binding domain protein n=1 Tax=Metarhizium album (strain ARSEF 1941) TaxID=1081103 RepID=A0A0B2WM55_METAS|nr:NAD(P)-binding domain protein [Metarhizium album ARSEF 1941]KHN95033.1 NAD(P)-binding domain protein [Metarhizium album ARSEF 1941]